LVNFGVLPLTFAHCGDYDRIELGEVIRLSGVHRALRSGRELSASVAGGKRTIVLLHDLSRRQLDLLLSGGARQGSQA
jgi:aconitate hydratase